tara:strand:+ start:623 stop:736 length:114 start_codon:yes stop_codon:yes gene_type:complete
LKLAARQIADKGISQSANTNLIQGFLLFIAANTRRQL